MSCKYTQLYQKDKNTGIYSSSLRFPLQFQPLALHHISVITHVEYMTISGNLPSLGDLHLSQPQGFPLLSLLFVARRKIYLSLNPKLNQGPTRRCASARFRRMKKVSSLGIEVMRLIAGGEKLSHLLGSLRFSKL